MVPLLLLLVLVAPACAGVAGVGGAVLETVTDKGPEAALCAAALTGAAMECAAGALGRAAVRKGRVPQDEDARGTRFRARALLLPTLTRSSAQFSPRRRWKRHARR